MAEGKDELAIKYKKLEELIDKIGTTFGPWTVDAPGEDQQNRYKDNYYIFGSRVSKKDIGRYEYWDIEKQKMKQERQLYRDIVKTIEEIKALDPEANFQNSKQLNKPISFTESGYYHDVGNWLYPIKSKHYPRNVAKTYIQQNGEKIQIDGITAVELILPKMILLHQFDYLIAEAELKLESIRQKYDNGSKEYAEVMGAASLFMEKVNEAREKIVNCESIESLTDYSKDIKEAYAASKAILKTHRGNPQINAVIDLVRGLMGGVVTIITKMFSLFIDKEKAAKYRESFFSPRETSSEKTFKFVEEHAEFDKLKEEAELPEIPKLKK